MTENPTPANPTPPEKESIFQRTARKCRGPCQKILPGEQFTVRGDGVCNECAEILREQEREIAKANKAERLMNDMFQEMGAQEGVPKIENVVGAIIGEFGGLNGFVKYYKDAIDKVRDKRGGPTVGLLNHMANIMKLVAVANQHTRHVNSDQMNALQIEREQRMMMLSMMLDAAKDEATASKLKEFLADNGLFDPKLVESQNTEMPS